MKNGVRYYKVKIHAAIKQRKRIFKNIERDREKRKRMEPKL